MRGKLARFLASVARRLRFAQFPFRVIRKAVSSLLWLAYKWWFGYGEQPARLLIIFTIVFVVIWMLYWQFGSFASSPEGEVLRFGRTTLKEALYYSLVSFTALGYGGWVTEPTGWAKWVGAVQPFFGIITAVVLSLSISQVLRRR